MSYNPRDDVELIFTPGVPPDPWWFPFYIALLGVGFFICIALALICKMQGKL